MSEAKEKEMQELKRIREKRYPWASDDQWDCILMAEKLFRGFHHLPKIKDFFPGIELRTSTDIATVDGDFLTRAVFLAHDEAIRFSIDPASPREIKLIFHKRKREGRLHERHPTLEQSVSAWRG